MSETLCVKWTITANEHPQPLLHCRRCCATQPFRTGGKMRVNANGKRIDAWLIYRCTACDGTWNRPVLERRPVGSIEPEILSKLMANDAQLVAQIASDAEDLQRHAPQLKEMAEVRVTKSVLSGNVSRSRALNIVLAVPQPVALRLDRLLAEELSLSRSRIHALAKSKALTVRASDTSRALRKPVREGTELTIRLPVAGAEWIAHSAVGGCGA
jgi:hypothetical protein